VRAAAPRAFVPFVLACSVWLGALAVLALRGAFDGAAVPAPALAGGPALAMILVAFAIPRSRRVLDALPLQTLTYLHLVRAGVEFVLFGLAMDHLLPVALTFAGRNFDIAAGFTAPIFGALAFAGGRPARGPLIAWNVIALGLLAYIVSLAARSGAHVLVELPFVWLPGFVVPIVAGSHLVALRQLLARPST
jgi:hypothetical protein